MDTDGVRQALKSKGPVKLSPPTNYLVLLSGEQIFHLKDSVPALFCILLSLKRQEITTGHTHNMTPQGSFVLVVPKVK